MCIMEYTFRFVKEMEWVFRFGREFGILDTRGRRTRLHTHHWRVGREVRMHDQHSGGRRERKDMRRNLERVLEAAHALFAERGASVTMEEVARRAGVGVGTLYRRFPSKEHLYLAVREVVCLDTHSCLESATAEHPDPVSKLRALVIMHYQRTQHVAALLEISADPAFGRGCITSDNQQFYARLHTMLEQIIVEGQQLGVLGAGNPHLLAAMCLQLLTPAAFRNLQLMLGGDAEAIAEHTVRFLLAGLAVRVVIPQEGRRRATAD